MNRILLIMMMAMGHLLVSAQDWKPALKENIPLDSIRLSDPFILACESTRTYYMTGTGGLLWKSKDLSQWTGPYIVTRTDPESWMGPRPMIWAAELHHYKGRYYYFATFTNRSVNIDTVRGNIIHRRACHVLVSDQPEGPYVPMEDAVYLPPDKPTLDGTFWIDKDEKPYMVYCYEWLQNWNGTIEKIGLKPDLSGTIGEGQVLFRASDSPWSRERNDEGNIIPNKVTDGPFLFETRTGKLGMLWSSWVFGDYCQGVAYSESGTLDGPWVHEDETITPPNYGHGMLFRTFEGKQLMAVHSHENVNGRTVRVPHLFEVDLSGDKLVLTGRYQNMFQSAYIKPQNIIRKEAGHYFVDFGKDAFGALVLNFSEAPSDSVIIHLGERLSEEGEIDRNPGGTIRYQKVILDDVPVNRSFQVEPAPDGRNDRYPAVLLPDTFGRIMPFRYCEIENLKIPITDMEISQKVFHYRFNDDASSFTCSDTVLNQVWELCKHTIKATSFCGKYVDGDRERIPYEADALINQLSHYAVDSEYTLAQRTNVYFIDHPTWPTEWVLQTIMLFYFDYLYTGNPEFLVKYYEHLKRKTLMPLARKDGLISTDSAQMTGELMESVGFDIDYTGRPIEDIVDWPQTERDGYEMVKVNTVVNSFYYNSLKLMAEIAEVVGMKKDARDFHHRSVLVRNTINEKLFNAGTGLYVDGEGSNHSSLHANMFPLAFGIVPEEQKESVVTFIKSKGMSCSVYGAQYLLEALYGAGEDKYAFHLMTATEGDRNWWNMIRIGSTMTLEAWDEKYKPNLDWNHAWGAAPANIITRRMWGITPAVAGFEKARIRPQMADLASSAIKVPTSKGPIYAEYKKTESGYLYLFTLPRGMTGEFHSVYKDARIRLNGKPVRAKASKVKLTEGTNKIDIIKN